jgi:hypothetical protein
LEERFLHNLLRVRMRLAERKSGYPKREVKKRLLIQPILKISRRSELDLRQAMSVSIADIF